MGKDPAILWYPNDYLGGTMGMTFEEKGAYIELLMMQFNRGHMTSHMIGQIVGQLWDKLKDKFVQDENGLWYNKRLEEEQNKRKAYTNSRRNNKKGNNQYTKKNNKSGHMTTHTAGHMENENENKNVDTRGKGGLGEKEKGHHLNLMQPIQPEELFGKKGKERIEIIKQELLANSHLTEGIQKNYNLTPDDARMYIESFVLHIEMSGDYTQAFSDLRKYCVNWIRLRMDRISEQRRKELRTGTRQEQMEYFMSL